MGRVIVRGGDGMARVRLLVLLAFCLLALGSVPRASVGAAAAFAHPAFQDLWRADETAIPNYWGPLALATDGLPEPYADAPGAQRLVQYFDKGRMELTDPARAVVTSGLLAEEMVTGRVQTGDATFQQGMPASIPLAGDDDLFTDPHYPGKAISPPTYATLANLHAAFLDSQPAAIGSATTREIAGATTGNVPATYALGASDPQGIIAAYDAATGHNIPAAFATFRDRAGIATIGLAISEPFWGSFKFGTGGKVVLVQVFERRVLTYTPDNPAAYRVEMGNVGLHYYLWRYGHSGAPPPLATSIPPDTAPATGICAAPARATVVSAPATVRPTVPITIAIRVYDDAGRRCGDGTHVIIAALRANVVFRPVDANFGTDYATLTVQGGVAMAIVTVAAGTPPGQAGAVTVQIYPADADFFRVRPAPISDAPWEPRIL
jgi:hypothetical protein